MSARNFAQQYPNLTGAILTGLILMLLLRACGALVFGESDPHQEPDTIARVRVHADRGWHRTAVFVDGKGELEIKVQEGLWTYRRDLATWTTGKGSAYTCADHIAEHLCVEPVPDSPVGALIGRVGEMTFYVGDEIQISPWTTGHLDLRINDADEGLYDNDGSLLVEVSLTE